MGTTNWTPQQVSEDQAYFPSNGSVPRQNVVEAANMLEISTWLTTLYSPPSQCPSLQTEITKLQSISHSTARVTTCTKKFDHITPVPNQRILFKVLVLTFKVLHNLASTYLQSLLTMYNLAHILQSSSTFSLVIPKVRTKTYGECAFSYVAPAAYNKLLAEITQSRSLGIFKWKLKTHLFQLAYPA